MQSESFDREDKRSDELRRRIADYEFLILKELRPHCLLSVGSTQVYLSKVLQSAHEGDFVISRIQLLGKGRMGRSWESDKGGLYLSLTLVPNEQILGKITLMLAEAVLETLESDFSLKHCKIKSPNDVLCIDKKIAGVLADATIKGKSPIVYAGIGVNLNNGDGWNEELRNTATSYHAQKGQIISEDEFSLKLLKRIDDRYFKLSTGPKQSDR